MAGILTQAAVRMRLAPGGIMRGCLSQRAWRSWRQFSWVARGLLRTLSTLTATMALVAAGRRSAREGKVARARPVGTRARRAAQKTSDRNRTDAAVRTLGAAVVLMNAPLLCACRAAGRYCWR